MNTKDKINHTRQLHRNNVFLAGSLCFVAWIFLLSPLFLAKMSKSLKGTYFLLGLISASALVIQTEQSRKVAGLKNAYDAYEKQGLSNEISNSRILDNHIDQIRAQENLVEVVERLPDYKRFRYVNDFKLFGLLKPMQGVSATGQIEEAPQTVKIAKSLPVFDKKTADMIDTSWMNHDFFWKSAVITGDEGSGKTQLLAFIAANQMAMCPDVDIKIHNIHWDEDDPWFPGMPIDIERSLFITDPAECFNDMMNVVAEVRRREIAKEKTGCPVVRITDEFQGLADILGKDNWAEYINAIKQIKNRGRKYARKVDGKDTGMRIIAGTHSLKKGETGLDSGFFAGANVVCLRDSIKDPNTPFPADFDIKALTKELTMANAQLAQVGLMKPGEPHLDKARAAVVRLANGSPTIRVIPRPDLKKVIYELLDGDDEAIDVSAQDGVPTIEYQNVVPPKSQPESHASQYPGNDWMERLKNFYRANKGDVSDEILVREILVMTGKVVTVQHVQKLRELLNESKEDE